MKVSVERLDNCRVAMTIEVEEERLRKAMHSAARRLSHRRSIPGFRRGKAPYDAVVRAFGEDLIFGQAVEELGDVIYKEALDEAGIEPFAPGELEDVKRDPFSLQVVVPIAPVVELGDYRQIRVQPKEIEVLDENVDRVVEDIRRNNAPWEPSERPAQMGDLVIVDIEGTVGEARVLSNKGRNLVLNANDPFPMPGFGQKLVGVEAGQRVELDLPYPEDYPNPAIAGKEGHFVVRVHEVKKQELPPINDALAQTVGFETLLDLRGNIRKMLYEGAQREAEEEVNEEITKTILAGAQIEFPPQLVDWEVERLWEVQEKKFVEQGLSMDLLLSLLKTTEDGYRQQLRPQAEDNVRRALAFRKMVELEGIEISPGEVEQEIDRLVSETIAETKMKKQEKEETKESEEKWWSVQTQDEEEKDEEWWDVRVQARKMRERAELRESLATKEMKDRLESRLLLEKTYQRLRDIAQGKLEGQSGPKSSQGPEKKM